MLTTPGGIFDPVTVETGKASLRCLPISYLRLLDVGDAR